MTNEDIIKYLMDIKDKQLSACELAAIEDAINIISDYDKAAQLFRPADIRVRDSNQSREDGRELLRLSKMRQEGSIQAHALSLVRTANDMEAEYGNNRSVYSRGASSA